MSHVITLIPGDGIGPEVTEAVIRIFQAAALDIEWERHDAGVTAFQKYNQSLPAALLESIRRNKVALKGPVTTPIAEGFTSVNVGLRKALELYANLRPVRNLPGVASRFSGVDLVIVRENTEDLYAGLEHEIVPGVVESLKIITEKASTRVSQFAFQHARANGRRRVTAIHKANIMKLSDGLFLESTRKVSREFTDITYDERIVDAACMQLVMRPGNVRRAAAPEPLRRHRVRPVRGTGRRARRRAWGEHGDRLRRVRGGPRKRARHRRQEPGEPHGPAAVRPDDARPYRRAAAGGTHPRRAGARAGRRCRSYSRSRWNRLDDRVHRCHLPGDRDVI